jgi:hypothetical protein
VRADGITDGFTGVNQLEQSFIKSVTFTWKESWPIPSTSNLQSCPCMIRFNIIFPLFLQQQYSLKSASYPQEMNYVYVYEFL